jgi:hypothetical protein
MRYFARTGAVAVSCLLLVSGARMQAQAGGQMGGGRLGQAVQGTVTAVASGKLTIKTDAGDSYDVMVSDISRIMENRQQIKLTDIKPGDSVMAVGQTDTAKKTVQAMIVNATDAATVAKAKENLGKTYITGRIAAIDADNLKITVMRRDSVSQVIAVDDGTSFQRGNNGVAAEVAAAGGGTFGDGMRTGGRQAGGSQAAPPAPESITLADIRVGYSIMATGALKGGTFTVLKMGVSDPAMGPPGAAGVARRRRPDGQPGSQIPPPQGPVTTPQ